MSQHRSSSFRPSSSRPESSDVDEPPSPLPPHRRPPRVRVPVISSSSSVAPGSSSPALPPSSIGHPRTGPGLSSLPGPPSSGAQPRSQGRIIPETSPFRLSSLSPFLPPAPGLPSGGDVDAPIVISSDRISHPSSHRRQISAPLPIRSSPPAVRSSPAATRNVREPSVPLQQFQIPAIIEEPPASSPPPSALLQSTPPLPCPPGLLPPNPGHHPWQFRAKSATTVHIFDSRDEYADAIRFLSHPRDLHWWKCGPGVQAVFNTPGIMGVRFSPHQKVLFTILFRGYRQWVSRRGGINNCHDNDTFLVWNMHTWIHHIIRFVNQIGNIDTMSAKYTPPELFNGGWRNVCWYSASSQVEKSGRPNLQLYFGQVEIRGNIIRKTPQWARDPKNNYLAVAKFAGILQMGRLPSDKEETSHLCYNNPQKCVNPAHVTFEDHATNHGRNHCVNGFAFLCPHDPKCIFTDSSGRWLPCRNSVDPLALPTCTHSDPPCNTTTHTLKRPREEE